MKKFSITLPEGFAAALSRRHNGREDITRDQIIDGRIEMQMLWDAYQKVRDKLDYVEGEWWDKMKVENHFKQSRWYYAHRKRKKLMEEKKQLHKRMFYLLVYTDGNREDFDGGSLDAESCYIDFMGKYKLSKKQP